MLKEVGKHEDFATFIDMALSIKLDISTKLIPCGAAFSFRRQLALKTIPRGSYIFIYTQAAHKEETKKQAT